MKRWIPLVGFFLLYTGIVALGQFTQTGGFIKGPITPGDCAKFDSAFYIVDAGAPCNTFIPTIYWWNPIIAAGTARVFVATVMGNNGISWSNMMGPEVKVTFGNIVFKVDTADANTSDFYDLGIYGPCAVNSTCSLVCNIGSQNFTTTGVKNLACTQGTVTISPPPSGQYYWYATTGNVTNIAAYDSANAQLWSVDCGGNGTGTAGTLPSTATSPISNIQNCTGLTPILALH
jgi:hypothetical protein